jgi:cobalt-precorrin 5A hydrolase
VTSSFSILAFTERGEALGQRLAQALRGLAAGDAAAGEVAAAVAAAGDAAAGDTAAGDAAAAVAGDAAAGDVAAAVAAAGDAAAAVAGDTAVAGDAVAAVAVVAAAVDAAAAKVVVHRVTDLGGTTAALFKSGAVLVFIGSAGIAVRAIAPLLQSKVSDPAVIVIDEAGQYVIPVLSGHLGGANRYARQIASLINATPVITTATDVNQVFAFDAFAQEQGYAVLNPALIKVVAATMLNGQTVGLYSDFAIDGELPAFVDCDSERPVGVAISLNSQCQPFLRTLNLVPRCIHVGIGARRMVSTTALEGFFLKSLAKLGLPIQAVAAIASIDLKQDEPAILALVEKYHLAFHIYTAEQLNQVAGRFAQSERVSKVTGTGNVCEAAAYLSAAAGELLLSKTVQDQATLAIAIQDWRVGF